MVDEGVERLKNYGRAKEPWLRAIACIRLWSAGDASCLPELRNFCSGKLPRPPWLLPVARSVSREFSTESLREGIRRREVRAKKAAAVLRERAAVEVIVTELAKPTPSTRELHELTLRANLAWTLGEIGDRRAIPCLLKELREGDYWSKADAAEALGKLGDASVVPDLVEAVEEATALAQAEIFLALRRLGTEEEIPLLETYARSTEYTGAIGRARCAREAISEIRKRSR